MAITWNYKIQTLADDDAGDTGATKDTGSTEGTGSTEAAEGTAASSATSSTASSTASSTTSSTDSSTITNTTDKTKTYKLSTSIKSVKYDSSGIYSGVIPEKYVAVDTNEITLGSIVVIDGTKYTASTGIPDASVTEKIVMTYNSTTETLEAGNKTGVEVIVYPPGTDPSDNTSAAEISAAGTTSAGSTDSSGYTSSWLGTDGVNSKDAGTVDTTGVKVIGAGVPPASMGSYGIVDFASFAEKLAFKVQMQQGFNEDGMQTLHSYLSEFMQKFYHQLYYIPNLKDNYVMVVKPETLFINAPSCNLIFPNIKSTISYSIPFKEQPTRLVQQSDPIAASGGGQTPFTLTAMMFMEEKDLGTLKNGLPMRETYVTSLGKGNLTDKNHPMLNLTNFESRNGIRASNVNQGADIYLFLQSKDGPSGGEGENYQISLPSDSSQLAGVGNTLGGLARYELSRQRYVCRGGSIDMYFNPYIVPGFPFVSVEGTTGGMNVYGYVTGVVHNITERSWTTTVSFNCGHSDTEQSPGAFPIVESEYVANIASTYKNMLGDMVTPVTNVDIPTIMEKYASESQYMTMSYKKIWRETPTIESYLKDVADGAEIVQMDDYWYFKGSFFDETLQKRIREYTEDLMVYKYAMSNDDYR